MKHKKHSDIKHDKDEKKGPEHASGIEGQDAARHQGNKEHHPFSRGGKPK